MTTTPAHLLRRLDEIGGALARDGRSLALIGVGSVGAEMNRLDGFSDLDFFVVAQDGNHHELIDDLSWLEAAAPLAFSFRNTVDGHKFFFEDGVYGEFAVFTRESIADIPAHGERIVWSADEFDWATLERRPPDLERRSEEWMAGELLTNLYVGLTRLARGEALAAFRFVQVLAVDQLLRILWARSDGSRGQPDPHDLTRRAEQAFPEQTQQLDDLMRGYGGTIESALAMLALVERIAVVDPYVKARIVAAANEAEAARAASGQQ